MLQCDRGFDFRGECMRELIFDAGPLITCCQYSAVGQVVIEHMLKASRIVITSSVHDEVVVAGNRYADAQVAHRLVSQGLITVVSPPANPDLEAVIAVYGLGQGEQDSILLTTHQDMADATLVLDDHLAYLVSDRLAVRKRFLLDVIVDLARAGDLNVAVALAMVQVIRSRYPKSFVEHTLLLLKR